MFGIIHLPLDKAIVHSCGSTVYKRPSYLMSAFEIRLILEPNSGRPPLMFASNYITVSSRVYINFNEYFTKFLYGIKLTVSAYGRHRRRIEIIK